MLISIEADKCPECDSKEISIDEKRGEIVCKKCGYVLESKAGELSKEYNSGKVLKKKGENKLVFLTEGAIKTDFEKKMAPFYNLLNKIKLPSHVRKRVINICKEAVRRKITMSYSKREIFCAAIWISMQEAEIPIFKKTLKEQFNVIEKKMMKAYKKLRRELNIDNLRPFKAKDYIPVILEGFDRIDLLKESISKSEELDITNPLTKASVAVWVTGKNKEEKITQREISRLTGISKVTIRKNSKKVSED